MMNLLSGVNVVSAHPVACVHGGVWSGSELSSSERGLRVAPGVSRGRVSAPERAENNAAFEWGH